MCSVDFTHGYGTVHGQDETGTDAAGLDEKGRNKNDDGMKQYLSSPLRKIELLPRLAELTWRLDQCREQGEPASDLYKGIQWRLSGFSARCRGAAKSAVHLWTWQSEKTLTHDQLPDPPA